MIPATQNGVGRTHATSRRSSTIAPSETGTRRTRQNASERLALALFATACLGATGAAQTDLSVSIPLGTNPNDIVIDSTRNLIYTIAFFPDGTVSVIDGATEAVVDTIQIGPYEDYGGVLALDEAANRLYATIQTTNEVVVIDAATRTVEARIDSGGHGLYGICLDTSRNRAYAVNFWEATLAVIDTVTNSRIAVLPISTLPDGEAVPVTCVADPATGRVYVTVNGTNEVVVFDGIGLTEVARIPVAADPFGLAFHDGRNELYVTGRGTTDVTVIDTGSNTVTALIGLPVIVDGFQTSLSEETDTFYTVPVDALDNQIYAVDVAARQVVDTYTVGSGFGIVTENSATGILYYMSIWESIVGIIERAAPVSDTDGDGLDDSDELTLGTDPNLPDTDGDGLSDGDEVHSYFTDPLAMDTDGDGLTDGNEIALQAFGCPDPLVFDTDADGLGDGTEVGMGLNPCDNADFDLDGLMDAQEVLDFSTDPTNPDTDGDGMLDGTEVDVAMGTGCPDPLDPDSDDDGLLDGDEADNMINGVFPTDPCNADTDGDGLPDNIDPLPTDPTGTEDFVAQDLRSLCSHVAALDLSLFLAPNHNAAKGRRNAICNKLNAAANAISAGNIQDAIDQLESLKRKLDGQPSPKDWMAPGTMEVDVVASWIDDELELLGYL